MMCAAWPLWQASTVSTPPSLHRLCTDHARLMCAQAATPVVSVHYSGVCYRLRVKPGQEGFEAFRRQLHKITGVLRAVTVAFASSAPH